MLLSSDRDVFIPGLCSLYPVAGIVRAAARDTLGIACPLAKSYSRAPSRFRIEPWRHFFGSAAAGVGKSVL
jgi:hypothetical protein